MIRGRSCFSLAVRRESGDVQTISEPLSEIFTGRVRRVPFLRGMLVLAETLNPGNQGAQPLGYYSPERPDR